MNIFLKLLFNFMGILILLIKNIDFKFLELYKRIIFKILYYLLLYILSIYQDIILIFLI